MSDRPAVLVTGGAGYIGAHCCRALAAAGYQPVVYDNFSTGHRSFVTGPAVVGDLLDRSTLASAFAQHRIAAVMHFAAFSLVGESVVNPQKYYINNVAGTLSLLEVMREAGCSRLVFSSTGAVYGNADSKALPETYACEPINPYGSSKWMIERICRTIARPMGSVRSACAISTPAAPMHPRRSANCASRKHTSSRAR